MSLSWVDLLVIGVYLVGVTIFGAHFRKSQHNIRDYFLGGHRLPWWAIALSIVSAETSILTIISTPGLAYTGNFGFLQLVMGYIVARVLISFILIPRYFAGQLYTAYQLIEQRFGQRMKVFTATLFLITRAFAEGVRVFAISIVIEAVLHTGVFTSVVLITALTLFYTYHGGFTAVIWTDVIQLVIYITGTVVALLMALTMIPDGWLEVTRLAAVEGDKLAVFNLNFNFHQPYLFWSGLIGGTFLSMASHGTDQLIVQRLLAAKTKLQSQAALVASGLIVFCQFSLFLLVGAVLFAFYRHYPPAEAFSRPDQVFPQFVVTQLPTGLAGLVIAAILAAAMANLSASFNSLASSSVVDFYRPFFRPEADDKHYLRVSRAMTLVWGVMLVVIALFAQYVQRSVIELALTIASVPYGSMLGIFLLGVLTRRATGTGAVIGGISGVAVLVAVMAFTPIAWTWYAAIGTTVTFAVGMAVSRVQRNGEF